MISVVFSRRSRRPKSAELVKAWECLDSGDLPAAVRRLRAAGEDVPVAEVALVVERAAQAAGFDDLEQAAAALAARPDHAQNLFHFRYACVGRGLAFLAIPPLRTVLSHNPGALMVLRELVSAYEREERHQEAMAKRPGTRTGSPTGRTGVCWSTTRSWRAISAWPAVSTRCCPSRRTRGGCPHGTAGPGCWSGPPPSASRRICATGSM
ncbi:hypothetical protein ABTY98_02805 [Streptomyces sp. NPDC096040]|uniref:hypothetical protein n=1 Tax=Streptomyces sp. NPDC096040 TaxID=3155541 RepID=UPI00332006AC